jgi:hypothetical protein
MRHLFFGSLVVALLLFSASALRAQAHADAAGHWVGKILIPNQELSVTVDLARNADGAWIGSMTIPPAAVDAPLEAVDVEDGGVRFAAALPFKTAFVGTLSSEGNSVSGTASNAEGGVPFRLTRSGDADVKTPPASSRLRKDLEGTWQGTVNSDGAPRRVVMMLSAAADGTAMATLISVDKGNVNIPVTTVTVQDNVLQLDVRSIGGSYRGTVNGNEISGEWVEPSVRLPLTFKRTTPDAK